MITKLIGALANKLGVNPPSVALVSGLLVGAGLAGTSTAFVAATLGHKFGYEEGFHSADKTAELNRAKLELATARADVKIAKEAEEAHRVIAAVNADALVAAEEKAREYAKEIQDRGSPPAAQVVTVPGPSDCSLNDADVARMRERYDRRSNAKNRHPLPPKRPGGNS